MVLPDNTTDREKGKFLETEQEEVAIRTESTPE